MNRPTSTGFLAAGMTFDSEHQALEWKKKHPDGFVAKTEKLSKYLDCNKVYLVKTETTETVSLL